MIEVKNLQKVFERTNENNVEEKFLALDNINFKAKSNEIIGILGPNGAGKTTLLRIIAGIMKPSKGTININNLTYQTAEIKIKKGIAFLSGNTKLYKNISAYELLKMCGEFYNVPKEKLKNRIEKIVKVLNMQTFLNNRIGNLSTGQAQKVNIARCLVADPKIYILDEATNGLDIISSQIILNFIKAEKKRHKCILYSTHYMEEAENICDRVILINKGKIIASGSPKDIKLQTKTSNLRDAFFSLLGGVDNE